MTKFFSWLRAQLRGADFLNLDLLITLFFCIFWIFFSYQFGFNNSPDSWYRGVLGKSLVEGHPYYINLRQGWLYDYGAWHHDAAHSPLLPVLYAIFFLFFGYKISIANIIVTLSAAVLIFPLLRISRKLFETPLPAFLIYFLVVLNDRNNFLFETFAGLSLPTTLMLLAFIMYFLLELLESDNKIFLWGGVISLVAFYYIRPGEQVVFFCLLLWSLFLGKFFLERSKYQRLVRLWGWSLLLVIPWVLRKIILFRHPFFTHTTAALWTDRGYDYWSYHESMPLPTMSSYLSTHSLADLLYKVFIGGPGNFYYIFDRSVYGPLWIYLLVFGLALLLVFRWVRAESQRFLFVMVVGAFAAYSAVYSLVPVLDCRYMMMLYFLIIFTLVSALFLALRNYPSLYQKLKSRTGSLAACLLLISWLVVCWPAVSSYLRYSYRTSENVLRNDELVNRLPGLVEKDAVILGPFAKVQRLSFATGLTLIEEPDNLKQLKDPAAFFRKYNIRYSLVDVSGILPRGMIEKSEPVGKDKLFTIKVVQ